MDDEDLFLEDWKITKDRIKHFDDIVMRTRVQGLPIASAIQAAAFATLGNVGTIHTRVLYQEISVFSMIVVASLVYLIPVLLLDILHFKLLIRSIDHAYEIEEMARFKGKLGITHKLKDRDLTILHAAGGYGIYAVVFAAGIYFAFFGANDIISSLNNVATKP